MTFDYVRNFKVICDDHILFCTRSSFVATLCFLFTPQSHSLKEIFFIHKKNVGMVGRKVNFGTFTFIHTHGRTLSSSVVSGDI